MFRGKSPSPWKDLTNWLSLLSDNYLKLGIGQVTDLFLEEQCVGTVFLVEFV